MESHLVIGLRLEGMQKMGFIWARIDSHSSPWGNALGTWADVRVVGLRDDVPAPFIGFPQRNMKMGAQVSVVTQGSIINGQASETVHNIGMTHHNKYTTSERLAISEQRMNSESPAPGQRQWGGGKSWGGGGKFMTHDPFTNNTTDQRSSQSPAPGIRHW